MGDVQALIKLLVSGKIDASTLSDESSPCVVSGFMSTGCYALDVILGGGLPLGRMVEVYGDTSTGKSLLAAQVCAEAQSEGGVAVYIDTETAVSLPIMEAVGVDVDNLVYLAPDTVEEVFKAMELVVDSHEPDAGDMIVIWDSVAATSSKSEMDGTTGDVGYLTHSRVISQGLRRLTRKVAKRRVSLLFLNQAKQRIGVMFGDKVATFGGKSVGFHASIRLQLKLLSKMKIGKGKATRVAGIRVLAKVTKNKVAVPFREVILPIYFGHGVDDAYCSLELLQAQGEVIAKGSYWSMPEVFDNNFRRAEWPALYDEHYDAICDLIEYAVLSKDML